MGDFVEEGHGGMFETDAQPDKEECEEGQADD